MQIADEDARRLLESRHDLSKSADPAALSAVAARQGALVDARETLVAARASLLAAIREEARERKETARSRTRFGSLRAEGARWYDYVRVNAQTTLLNVAPDAVNAEDELLERRQLYQNTFGLASSDLFGLGADALIQHAELIGKALTDEPRLAAIEGAARLATLLNALEAHKEEVDRELLEDTAAIRNLRAQRASFEHADRGFGLAVGWVLHAEGRADAQRLFRKRLDPAYRARLQAGRAASEEEGGQDVLIEVDPDASNLPPQP